jgi:hypothetical protein
VTVALQGCVIIALQGCVIVALRGCVIVALQSCVIVALHGCVIVALQSCVIVALQGCVIVALQCCVIAVLLSGCFFLFSLPSFVIVMSYFFFLPGHLSQHAKAATAEDPIQPKKCEKFKSVRFLSFTKKLAAVSPFRKLRLYNFCF